MNISGRLGPDVTIVAHEIHDRGGQERVTARLVQFLLDSGWRVTIIARRCELEEHPFLRKISVPGPARPGALAFPWFFVVGGWLVKRHRRGLLHVNGPIVPNRADVATVHFCHRAFERVRAAEGFRRAQRRSAPYLANELAVSILYRAAERVVYQPSRRRRLVAVSEGLSRDLKAQFPRMGDAVEAIPNGVDAGAFRPDPQARTRVRSELGMSDGQLVCIFVGGDWERKGLRFAIEALAASPDWILVVVGRGDVKRYEGLARQARVSDRVLFVGSQPDTARFYAAADALVLPTAYETSCLVAFEAAAAGLPPLVTAVHGLPEMLAEERDACVISRDAESVAASLNRLTDAAVRTRLGQRARALTASFTWTAAGERYSALYRRLHVAA